MRTIVVFKVVSSPSKSGLVAVRRIDQKTLSRYMKDPDSLINREIELPFRIFRMATPEVLPASITVCSTNDEARNVAKQFVSQLNAELYTVLNPANDDFGIVPHQTPKKRLITTDPEILRKRIAKAEVKLQNLQRSLDRDRAALAQAEQQS